MPDHRIHCNRHHTTIITAKFKNKLHAFYQNQAFSIHLFVSDPSAAEFSRFYPSLRSRMRLNPKISGVEQHGLKFILIVISMVSKKTLSIMFSVSNSYFFQVLWSFVSGFRYSIRCYRNFGFFFRFWNHGIFMA